MSPARSAARSGIPCISARQNFACVDLSIGAARLSFDEGTDLACIARVKRLADELEQQKQKLASLERRLLGPRNEKMPPMASEVQRDANRLGSNRHAERECGLGERANIGALKRILDARCRWLASRPA